MWDKIVWVIGGYLIGSISVALLVATVKDVNLRAQGSGNLGATNVARVIGKKWGLLVLVLDALKAYIPTYFAMQTFTSPWWHVGVGVSVVVGHSLSVFAQFKGGKGVAPALGMLLALNPVVSASIVTLSITVMAITKIVSLGSILGCLLIPIGFYLGAAPIEYTLLVTLMSVFIIWRHRSNISRLLQGKENKFNG